MKKGEQRSGTPLFMMTWGDMMTLLLTFFVALIAMAQFNIIKVTAVVTSLKRAMGVLEHDTSPEKKREMMVSSPAIGPIPGKPTGAEMSAVEELKKEIELRAEVSGTLFQVLGTQEGSVIRMKEELLFDPGSAELKPEGKAFLERIAKYLSQTPYTIRVEGHTDDRPIRTEKFPSNWELSSARSASVVHILEESGVAKDRLSAVGYADTIPLLPNTSPENRALNRRVEIKLISIPEGVK